MAQAFGRDIPIPTYLPEEYAITEAQFSGHVELSITTLRKPEIILKIYWIQHGPFRILPGDDDLTIDVSGGSGTYSKWAVLHFSSDNNDLWWDWIQGNFPTNSTGLPSYYEMVLSASKEVPPEELVNIARFVRIP